ncbi:MAG: hypothetical protein FP825_05020 [Hyphomonas sp.]|nr:hypothetical protein [Hyphomonas sp.]
MAQDLRVGLAMPALKLSSRAKVPVFACVLAGIGLAVLRPQEIILYNPTASLEPGFYIRADLPIERGGVVTIPVHAARLAYVREGHVRAAGDRFLKRVAAMEGDRVCSSNGRITINDAEAAKVFETDSAGIALPSWSGCVTLKGTEVFLLGDDARSFDGRYWGITPQTDIEGTWRRFP